MIHKDDNKRMMLAAILSLLIIVVWQFILPPEYKPTSKTGAKNINNEIAHNNANNTYQYADNNKDIKTHDNYLNTSIKKDNQNYDENHANNRVNIETMYLNGSINLIGAQIDDIILMKYKKDIEHKYKENVNNANNIDYENSLNDININDKNITNNTHNNNTHNKNNAHKGNANDDNIKINVNGEEALNKDEYVRLLSPQNSTAPYFIALNWIDGTKTIHMPDSKTKWHANKTKIQANDTVVLSWTNDQGIKFKIDINIDDKYMLNIKQSISNTTKDTINVTGYVTINRVKTNVNSEMMSNDGAIGVVNNKLYENDFEDIKDSRNIDYNENIMWLGFSDKYWLVAAIPGDETFQKDTMQTKNAVQAKNVTQTYNKARILNYKYNGIDLGFQISAIKKNAQIESNNEHSEYHRFFIGAKELDSLEEYEKKYNISLFDRAVDFGILYFITKPIFILLTYFNKLIGNFGLAIMLLTVCIKTLLFPLAYKGFKSMNKLKDLQPKIKKLQEMYKKDPTTLQRAMLDLYKKEKANPMSGCLPILLQMPVFFALYKVLYVTIEMRHASFFGWLNDLSAPDPTTIFNAFGILPWNPPMFLMIGVLPILMGLTMYMQQMLNPQPTDPIQAKVMRLMPFVLTFMFASFPSGLVLYWVWSNILSIIQQIMIKKLSISKIGHI